MTTETEEPWTVHGSAVRGVVAWFVERCHEQRGNYGEARAFHADYAALCEERRFITYTRAGLAQALSLRGLDAKPRARYWRGVALLPLPDGVAS